MKNEGKIRKYLIEKRNLNPLAAEKLLNRYKRYDDILNEFLVFIDNETYPENGVESAGWTATTLAEKLPHLEPQTIYEFLSGLRAEPEKYNKYIEEGAPTL